MAIILVAITINLTELIPRDPPLTSRLCLPKPTSIIVFQSSVSENTTSSTSSSANGTSDKRSGLRRRRSEVCTPLPPLLSLPPLPPPHPMPTRGAFHRQPTAQKRCLWTEVTLKGPVLKRTRMPCDRQPTNSVRKTRDQLRSSHGAPTRRMALRMATAVIISDSTSFLLLLLLFVFRSLKPFSSHFMAD